jgi:hypothetical protein
MKLGIYVESGAGLKKRVGPHAAQQQMAGQQLLSAGTDGGGRDRTLGDDVDDATTTLLAELDIPRRQREQGVVLTAADEVARVEVGAALANDDLAGIDQLAAVTLHAQVLSVRVTTVT